MNLKAKAYRKALVIAEQAAQRKKKKTIQKWVQDWHESRPDYPTHKSAKKRKPLTWAQIRTFLKTIK